MVLVVGSHEPRKNHVAVLHAAERLWGEGLRFSLVMVGGNAWNGDRFQRELTRLQGRGRPVEPVTAISDGELWAAYRLARCVLFPSLHEGFGLPVAEALAVATPALTSNVGSMAEIAADGGALTVDPRDDDALVRGFRALLIDDDLHRRLVDLARARPRRSWDDYAREAWTALVGDLRYPDRWPQPPDRATARA
jgi:glycosyltransferase involved in cell wall biosynthesis